MSIPLLQTGPGGAFTTAYIARDARLVAITGAARPIASGNATDTESGAAGGSGAGRFASSFRRMLAAHRASKSSLAGAADAPRSMLDRILGVDRVEISPQALTAARRSLAPDAMSQAREGVAFAMIEAAKAWMSAQHAALEQATGLIRRLRAEATMLMPQRRADFADGLAVPLAVRSSPRGFAAIASIEVARFDPADSGRVPSRYAGSNRFTMGATLGASHEPYATSVEDPAVDSRIAHRSWLFADDAGTRRRTRHQQGHRIRARRGADQEGRAQARSQQGSLFVHL